MSEAKSLQRTGLTAVRASSELASRRIAFTAGTLAAFCLLFLVSACVSPDMRRDVTTIPNANLPPADERQTSTKPTVGTRIERDGILYVEVMEGESLRAVAGRVEVDPVALAQHNRMQVDDTPPAGTIVLVPAELQSSTETIVASVDAVQVADGSVESVDSPQPQPFQQPDFTRHRVRKGENAYEIARMYGVSVRTLAEWNDLDASFSVSAGDLLKVPMIKKSDLPEQTGEEAGADATVVAAPATEQPATEAEPAPGLASIEPKEMAPATDNSTTGTTSSEYVFPMAGSVTKGYSVEGDERHEGLRISGEAGTAIRAIADGKVALISDMVGNNVIIFILHGGNMYSVYQNVSDRTVREKQEVTRGQEIGRLGTEPGWLFFQIRLGLSSVNPSDYLPPASAT
ncbi:MAG: peptidoglycan DD-metalloendopeptidase family protein [Rhodobacteraceae bacterium]|nr:peptidoglycan DD-metalloendopeptidase family protein [Paracoccaceae bacterium]